MNKAIFCNLCDAEVFENDLYSHVETIHVGTRSTDSLYEISCGKCNFKVCGQSGQDMANHAQRTGHQASEIILDWSAYMTKEAKRVQEIIEGYVQLMRQKKLQDVKEEIIKRKNLSTSDAPLLAEHFIDDDGDHMKSCGIQKEKSLWDENFQQETDGYENSALQLDSAKDSARMTLDTKCNSFFSDRVYEESSPNLHDREMSHSRHQQDSLDGVAVSTNIRLKEADSNIVTPVEERNYSQRTPIRKQFVNSSASDASSESDGTGYSAFIPNNSENKFTQPPAEEAEEAPSQQKCEHCGNYVQHGRNEPEIHRSLIHHCLSKHCPVRLIECDLCGKELPSMVSFYAHKSKHRCNGKPISIISDEKREVVKERLLACFPNKKFDHELRHASYLGNFGSRKQTPSKIKFTAKCNICQFVLTGRRYMSDFKYGLMSHCQRHHVEGGFFKCLPCGKETVTEHDVTKHRRGKRCRDGRIKNISTAEKIQELKEKLKACYARYDFSHELSRLSRSYACGRE